MNAQDNRYQYVITTGNEIKLKEFARRHNFHGVSYREVDQETGAYVGPWVKAQKLNVQKTPADAIRNLHSQLVFTNGQFAQGVATTEALIAEVESMLPEEDEG